MLDLDALASADHESWVWKGARVLEPDEDRCLVSLSRGGADATVKREFDFRTKAFVKGGFELPESKSDASWRDRDVLYVGFAFDSSTMTTSGYARIVKEWRRGTPLASAKPIYEGEKTDVGVFVGRDPTPGYVRDFVVRIPAFYMNQMFLRRGDQLIKLDKPDDAEADAYREWLLIRLRKPWTVGGTTWPSGALLATRFDAFLAGKRDFQIVFEPKERVSLDNYFTTRDDIVLNTMDNVRSRLYVVQNRGGKWVSQPVAGLPEVATFKVSGVDPLRSNDYFLTITDFLTPSSLYLGTAGLGSPQKLKSNPEFFKSQGFVVTQQEAVSKDGTRIPYFVVAPKDLQATGATPTLLTGYGGFEVPELPAYNAVAGAGWIEKGGVYVSANIRGGGEFGPRWHEQGVKAERHHVYEDFIAVAEDLVKRGITSSSHLACIGGSNGGLLVGNMLTMRPDLFHAIVCAAPLLDMRRYHLLLAGASWMGEYGNPDDPKQWDFIRTWSPYQNVKKDVTYPRTLFTGSMRDDRVHPGHARKMAAKMIDQGHDVLFYENIEGGHAGAADNKQRAYVSAMQYTFLWQQLGPAEGSRTKATIVP